MDTTFIYFLKDPTNPIKGYVGKTNNPRTRLPRHLKDCLEQKHYRATWLKNLLVRGLKPTLEVIDEVPFEHWPQLEAAYIEFFLEQGYALTNTTPGGDCGPSMPGEKNPFFGKKHTPKSLAIMSAKSKTKCSPSGPEHYAFGKSPSDETRSKMRTAAEQREKPSQETCAKRRVKRPGASSEFRGTYWMPDKKKWRALFVLNGKQIFLGYFINELDSARAYDTAAKKYIGGLAKLNFPNE